MVGNMVEFGGCMTTNWHDRSLAPERMWGACYCALLADMKEHGAWFATAGEASSWFQKRRAVRFRAGDTDPLAVCAEVMAVQGESVPGLRLRVYNDGESRTLRPHSSEDFVDIFFDQSVNALAPCGANR
jgi:hypothetical protein